MVFTTCFFIRKNTPELRNKLEEFGYKILSPVLDKGENIIAGYYLYFNYCAFKNSDLNWFINYVKPIDCNQNEELFLAIAALRYDIDSNQYFVLQNGAIEKCECESKVDMWGDFDEEIGEKYPRKATVEELIEHFK